MLQPKVGRPHITLLESLQLKKKRNQKNFNDPTPEFLKNGSGTPGAGVPKPSQGLFEVQTIFIIILTGYLPFYSHFLMSVQWSFPELYDMWICKRLNIEADENPATSIVRH